MPSETELRRELCTYSHLLHRQGLVAGLDGNVSVRLPTGGFLATPTLSHLGTVQPDELVRIGVDGAMHGGRVTSEWPLHRAVYAARPDAVAVAHAHPPHVVAHTLNGEQLVTEALPEAVIALGTVSTVPYATTGTETLAAATARALSDADVAVLVRHGAVAVGASLRQAVARLEVLEHTARILHLAGGFIAPLAADEQARLGEVRRQMGGR